MSMPRYAPKNYGRKAANDNYASRTFDDLLNDKRGASTAKAAATAKAATMGSKWGKTSFTSTRTTSLTPTPMDTDVSVDSKKRKAENSSTSSNTIDLFDDPFSFDEEGPIRPPKTERRASPLTVGGGGHSHSQRAASKAASSAIAAESVYDDDDEEDFIPVRKVAIKTYGGRTGLTKNGSTKQQTVIKPLGGIGQTGDKNGSNNLLGGGGSNTRTQVSIANNTDTKKMPILTISRGRFGGGGGGGAGGSFNSQQQNPQNSQPVKKRFFVTSPTKSVDEDHNYSHRTADSLGPSSQESKLFESDYEDDDMGGGDSEAELLDSGDPEITFNTPKRRAQIAAAAAAAGRDAPATMSDDNDTLPDMDIIPGRASPFSISDDEDGESFPSRSSRGPSSQPAARYTACYSGSRNTLRLTKANSTGTTFTRKQKQGSNAATEEKASILYQRKPIFTYSRSRSKPPEPAASNSTVSGPSSSMPQLSRSGTLDLSSSSSSSLNSKRSGASYDLDQDNTGVKIKDRYARADSPASVGSASSSTSTSSATTGSQRNLKLTYSRKSRSDPSKMSAAAVDNSKATTVRKFLTSPKKSVAVYNPRPWSSDTDGGPSQEDEPSTGNKPLASTASGSAKASSAFDDFDADFDDDSKPTPLTTQPKFRRRVTVPETAWKDPEPVSKLQITKEHKPLFTVVRNVKQAHECQEHGETQEFQDDIDYILDGLQANQKETLRCLSTISLVSKSAMPAFRMHLRAHGTITKIYSALQDAPEYPTLALCTAGVMFMLSRDRLNMELDKPSLQLMLNLLSVDAKIPTERAAVAEYNRMKKRIQAICEDLNVDGKTRQYHLDLIDISPGKLAMESLLSLTSRKAGDWFKEDLRELGGLDHIVATVSKCSDSLDEVEIEPTPAMLDTLKKIDRCLRVLENVTMMNTENQNHLLHHNDSELTVAICLALRVCENCQPFNPVELSSEGELDKESTGYIVFSCMLAILRVLLNLTHDNEYGCRAVGQQSGIITTLLRCVLQVPQYISIEQRFDLLVLSLGLLINMIEHSDANRQILAEETTQGHYDSQNASVQISATTALTQFFAARFEAAERLEAEQALDHEQMQKNKKTDKKGLTETSNPDQDPNASGQWHESESGLEWVVIPEDERGEGGENGRTRTDLDDMLSQSSNDDDLDLIQGSQEEDENFTKALHKAGRHMEDSIIAAYISLLIGVILQHNTDIVDDIKDEVPGGTFEPMVKMLKKFLGFMNFTSSVSNGGKSIIRVIRTLEAC